ncbi:MAG: YIP1 family protein [Blastocatellia bacterium]|nr:YIP1 family protein [Blastocatellia bacterium]
MTEDTTAPKTDANGEAPQMSEIATVGNIFIEPGRTFDDLRRKPRFLLGGLLFILMISAFNILIIQKIGMETIARAQIEGSSRTANMSKEEKEKQIEMQSGTIAKVASYVITPIFLVLYLVIGGLIYWGGANAMGGSMTFLRGVSVWLYSSIPPTLLFFVSNVVVLFIKRVDEIDLTRVQQGLVQANPSFFIDGKSQPVLNAVLSTFDLFAIIGWVLAAIGLQRVGKISSGSAWGIILLIALLAMAIKVAAAAIFG